MFKDFLQKNEHNLLEVYKSQGLKHSLVDIRYEMFLREILWESQPHRKDMEQEEIRVLTQIDKKIEDISRQKQELSLEVQKCVC